MLWYESVQRPWWWLRKLSIIFFYSWGCNAVIANGMIITSCFQLWCLVQKWATQQNSSGIWCFILHQEKKKNLILITFNFALLTNPSWILVLEMINTLYVQQKGMRHLMNCLLISWKPCFNNSSSRIGITSIFIQLLVNKATQDLWRMGHCVGKTMDIIVRQTVQFLLLWRWRKWVTF